MALFNEPVKAGGGIIVEKKTPEELAGAAALGEAAKSKNKKKAEGGRGNWGVTFVAPGLLVVAYFLL